MFKAVIHYDKRYRSKKNKNKKNPPTGVMLDTD